MRIEFIENLSKRKSSDIVVVPFWGEKDKPKIAHKVGALESELKDVLHAGDFKADQEETLIAYHSGKHEKRFLLLGLGAAKEVSVEGLRRSYAAAVKACRSKKLSKIVIVLPTTNALTKEEIARGASEGIFLANYAFEMHKAHALKKGGAQLLEEVTFAEATKDAEKIIKESLTLSEAVYFARDLVNGNADMVTPQHLAAVAHGIAKGSKKVKTTVLTKKEIEKEKMGLLLAVNQGSHRDPAFIIVSYKGNPSSKDHTVLIGKGITYDTGGLNLKPTGSMETMRCDMGGAAAVLGTLKAIADLELKVNVTAVVPSTENSISATSYKPGDVYTSHSGKTVEIGNTDAEGRLVLADALSYTTKKLKPTRIIDFATLTGAMVITLGEVATGMMSNDDKLAESIACAGNATYERAWRLPLFEEYKKQLKSDVADIKNIGGKEAGSITAALFLQEFVGETPWAHLDIAGTAFLSQERFYNPKLATGVGVRLAVELLRSHK